MSALLRRLDAAIDRALLGPIEYAPIYSRQRTPGTPAPAADPLRRPVRSNRPSLAECLDFFCPPGP